MEKYFIIKQIGNITPTMHVVREFEDKQQAETFVSLLRLSEKLDCVKYYIAQVIDCTSY